MSGEHNLAERGQINSTISKSALMVKLKPSGVPGESEKQFEAVEVFVSGGGR